MLADQEEFSEANEFFESGKYKEALMIYKVIDKEGSVEAPHLFHNMARCYAAMDSLGHAIWYWEKARLHQPANSSYQESLQWAREQMIEREDENPEIFYKKSYRLFSERFNANQWLIFALCIWCLSLFLAAYLFWKQGWPWKPKWITPLIYALGILALILLLGPALSRYQVEYNNPSAIILSEPTQIHNGPSEESKLSFKLNAGNKVLKIEELKDWAKIKLADDREGWVHRKHLGDI